ncbi:TatD family hydrolase [Gloeocapsa sp. PCC 73106]|uniref:TatD family hydrolase n=1 Tax=Gloeocapsa sp. PCC 73106 TaxID=102232 RepID=UPI0002AC14EE|nr:TatD family hydrolase [Gloeocapsa sp. PCC 73106]ELR97860.1 hydrolase, TatD family [Gloeocapsa sp. PCC 73106]
MQLIDSHVHLNFEVFQQDLDLLQARWQQAGVTHLVHSCVEPGEFKSIQQVADRFPELSFAVGLHPLDAHKWENTTAREIRNLAKSDQRVVAIGETGLDYYKANNKEQQREVFLAQLSIAQDLNKPVIIHCRDAALELYSILKEFSTATSQPRGVMHCWGGTPEETQWFLDLGFYISFSGVVTFKNAKQIQESAKMVPGERLLIETDCPFLAPVPQRGKRNEPANVLYVAEFIAKLREVDVEILATQTTANAIKLFGLCNTTAQ